MGKIHEMTAARLREKLRKREIGAEELTSFYLERIEKYNPRINAIAELDETAIQQARAADSCREDKPLLGLPVLVKDNIDVKGLHTTAGSLTLSDNIAREDAPVIANLRRMGAVILGKTNMTEFANYTSRAMPNGYSSRGGQVYTAYSREIDASGSSTGSAAAMSAGFCAMAVGTDTSFSVVGCATVHGVTGLKPAHGTLSTRGIVPISHTLDSAGALTRNMTDALMLLGGMRGEALRMEPMQIKGMRIGVNRFRMEDVSKEQLARYDAMFSALRAEGVQLADVEHPWNRHMGTIMRCEFRCDLEEYLAGTDARIRTLAGIIDACRENPDTMMKYGIDTLEAAMQAGPGDAEYLEAMAEREWVRAQMREGMNQFDACIMTGPTSIMHFAGFPSAALPMCMAEDGTPRGMILYGADEERLYRAALAIERMLTGVLPPDIG